MTFAEKLLTIICCGYGINFNYRKQVNALEIVVRSKNNISIRRLIRLDDLFELNVLNEDILITTINEMIDDLKNVKYIKPENIRLLNFADNPTQ